MASSRPWRLFLAAALLVAAQSSLLHPFQHFHEQHAASVVTASSADGKHPFEALHDQLCNVCVAGAALGAAAAFYSATNCIFPSEGCAAPRRVGLFVAAFSPLFYSQAPPALL